MTAAMHYRGYQDFYSNGPYAQYLRHHSVVGSTTARFLYVSQPAGAFPDPPLPEFLVYLGVRGAKRLSFDWGCGRWEGAWHAEDISIAPPYTGTDINVDQPHAFLALALPASCVMSALDEIAPGRAVSFGSLHASTFRDALVAKYCKQLWQQTSADNRVSDKLSTDSLLFAMISALARRAHGSPSDVGSRLVGRSLARVLDVIDDRLPDDLSLAELAAVADLSPMHFARQFRRAVGLSPHQYVLCRRIGRAQALLGLTRHRLADIALAVGFSSQSHMTAVFARSLGITPLRYREQRRA
jgi:AraC-like DNA-binding protein